MNKLIQCEMLDSYGAWGSVCLQANDFTFKRNYDKDTSKSNVQLWLGNNGDLFILKNVLLVRGG